MLILNGGDGGDSLQASDSRTYLMGGAGDDFIDAFGATWYMHGGDGDDTLLGCSTSNNAEYYMGGNGTDTVYDASGTYRALIGTEYYSQHGC
jgi:Ca2+-binding RTX toxin-like protein